MPFYIGLLHYPVYNRSGEVIVSAITNLDLHDLARLARTYGVERFYVINPLIDQQDLARRIRSHWVSGHGAEYNKDRMEAMSLIAVVATLEEAIAEIREKEGTAPILVATDASNDRGETVPYSFVRGIAMSHRTVLILFGTAWGMARELIRDADYLLEPILGVSGYNHLSVRTAAAITLDRLFSQN
ncbi:MAG: RNA methyltransferase [Deltaproteobacteria bacterium]|nr:RNA methyltransferase [Deltaproteobacteria bacterium]MBW2077098.1 RNA methyltransferase [Deltaproteobacteria bacterium]MBW2310902.1 RNA methyltransferase [Deltaproteobacteria bacterium]RLB32134.1 MAG: RNA methyltransferase [Deltaproteobacteria bacterium]